MKEKGGGEHDNILLEAYYLQLYLVEALLLSKKPKPHRRGEN